VDGEGFAYLHRRIVSITSVSWYGASTPIDPLGYRVSSSSAIGGHDRIELAGALGWSDITILGAEPWNGGWAGYSARYGGARVVVVGTFGWATIPGAVRDATAQLAAYLRGNDADAEDPSVLVDTEGTVLPVAPSVRKTHQGTAEERESDTVRDRTTGYGVADELLADYVRRAVKIG
jgi:hypothetical protein